MSISLIRQQEVLGKTFSVYGDFENPLFLAKDVAEWIDYSKTSEGYYNVSKMLMSIDEEEKTTITISNSETGRACNQAFLTEDGLYEVLMLSRKPFAKLFKKEVKKILHSIRTNGGYIAGQENLSEEELIAKALVVAHNVIEQKDKRIAELTPQAQGYLEYVDRGRFCNFRDAANYMHIPQNEFMNLLRSKYIYKNSAGEYRCYAQYNELFALRPFTKGNQTGQQLMLTIAGLNHFGRALGEMHKERQQEIWQNAHKAAETLLKGMKPCFGTCAI